MLLLFAGTGPFADILAADGAEVTAVDVSLGGEAQDLARATVANHYLLRIAAGEFDLVFIATPCESYSPNHTEALRTVGSPEGVLPLPERARGYITYHNRLAAFTAVAITTASRAGALVALENSAKRGDEASPAYWPEMADRGSIWDVLAVATALRDAGAKGATFAMCAFGCAAQKWTTIMGTGALGSELRELARFVCPHGERKHAERARGYDAAGESWSRRTGAYTRALCFRLSAIIRRATGPAPAQPPPPPSHVGVEASGKITSGWALGPHSAAACEAARTCPPPFASLRNQEEASLAELKASPYPYHSGEPMRPKRPDRPRTATKRAAFPAPTPAPAAPAAEAEAIRPPGAHTTKKISRNEVDYLVFK